MLDTFWFDSREGNAEFYAGAFTVLMRAAGVPARLVTGYRGGKLMALTDYVVVKRSHAHAWVEILDASRGWRRIDPVDVIAPERFAGGAKPAEKPAPRPAAKPAPLSRQAQGGDTPSPSGSLAATGIAPMEQAGNSGFFPDLSAWLGRWVFRLDGEKQLALLAGKGGGMAWAWLLGAAALGSGMLFGILHLIERWREFRRVAAPERHWRRACGLLAKKGLTLCAGECPSDFARRVAAAQPAWSSAVTQLCRDYADWRYGRNPEASAAGVEVAARNLANRVLAG